MDISQTGSPRSSPGKSESYLSETRFDQLSPSPLSLKEIKDAGYEKMTVVQEATLPAILKEANTLLKYHPSVVVQVVIGGTRLALEQKNLQANPCQILVATPGRLRDHTENTAGFATRLMGVMVLVFDEADHLLAMGFCKEIEKIIAAVPKQQQTLFFSATVPEEVHQICHIALRIDHEFINTVEEGTEETHSVVRQMHMVASLDKHFSLVYSLLKGHIADDVDYKVGLPADRQQYIHRLGRTGRKVMKIKELAYQAWLGFYNSGKNVGRDKNRLVELVNEFSRSMVFVPNRPGAQPVIQYLKYHITREYITIED
ncbi:hypothetical protein CRYUN_Cryun01aG0216500 [Craigia yunnanensis]